MLNADINILSQFNEVSRHVDDIIKQHFPLPQTATQAPPSSSLPVTSCSSTAECSGNVSKKKCWLGQCVECHRHNQCVDPSKLSCNKQSLQCEAGNFLGAYLTRKLNAEIIVRDMNIMDSYLNDINTDSIPELFTDTRFNINSINYSLNI